MVRDTGRRNGVKYKSLSGVALAGVVQGQAAGQPLPLGTEQGHSLAKEWRRGQNLPCPLRASLALIFALCQTTGSERGKREKLAPLHCLISVWQHFSSRTAFKIQTSPGNMSILMIFFYGEVSNQMISTFTFCFNNVKRILSNER